MKLSSSLNRLFAGLVCAVAVAFIAREWLASSREIANLQAAIQKQTNSPQEISGGLFGFGLLVDFKGIPINETTADALSRNRRLHYFTLLNCPVSQNEVAILNRGDVFIMRGNDDEPPIGSLQGRRIARRDGFTLEQTNF